MTDLEEFLARADDIALDLAGMTEEDVLLLLPLLHKRLMVDLTGDMGEVKAAAAADALVAAISRRRLEIMAPTLH
jgi:hypothetical protein